ncbi:MAG: replication-associated recombination protein A [Brevinematales bacterium]|nr:replication-associated recombination protein A [Brevinematales bacterium]
MGLFSNLNQPLSRRMMPQTLEQFAGQTHLTAPGKPVAVMLENRILHSMIFYGPPATGKTSLAEILSNKLEYHFVMTNALTMDNEEIRKLLVQAENRSLAGERTVVFIDEIHRLIKPKQDAFLSAMENGIVTIIGATTENPYFIIQPAFRSRLFIYEFKILDKDDLDRILERSLAEDNMLKNLHIEFGEGARGKLIEYTPDPRMMLNTLEMVVLSQGAAETVRVTEEGILNILQKSETRYSSEEGHYDVISAFIKSVRGSAVDAAIYYLAMMLESGEDPLFIARRLIILASEDIGLAYPEALPMAVACYEAVQFIGLPEAQLVLSETTLLLAGVPKSNTALCINKARGDIRNGNVMKVPLHLKNAVFEAEKDTGKGVGYKYPHSFPNHYVDEKYTEKDVRYYEPGDLGFEKKIRDWLDKIKSPRE